MDNYRLLMSYETFQCCGTRPCKDGTRLKATQIGCYGQLPFIDELRDLPVLWNATLQGRNTAQSDYVVVETHPEEIGCYGQLPFIDELRDLPVSWNATLQGQNTPQSYYVAVETLDKRSVAMDNYRLLMSYETFQCCGTRPCKNGTRPKATTLLLKHTPVKRSVAMDNYRLLMSYETFQCCGTRPCKDGTRVKATTLLLKHTPSRDRLLWTITVY
ncbi:hypothetical protein J6590_095796 [Homalodisca vitripennis]|nr:hypothetical protein J6590_067354 [Homalodisca vitripennis]KAG8255312.1 hypothetical protein J6590_095796 [Homalodisca vitripennis]